MGRSERQTAETTQRNKRTAMANLERGKASHSLAAMRKPRLAMVPSSHEVFQGGVASVPRWSGMQ